MVLTSIIVVFSIVILLVVNNATPSIWGIVFWLGLILISKFANFNHTFLVMLWFLSILSFSLLYFTNVRKFLISNIIFKIYQRMMPNMSDTEREALEAGTISWEADLLNGSPDFDKLLDLPVANLREDEKSFIANELQSVCSMIDDWDITHNLTDLPESVWEYLKEHKFFGMIIPREYGGLGFSSTAVAKVLVTLYGKSITAATTVGVPNSLGPAELLLKYGTKEQKAHYLPRLACGEDIPCFALTNKHAGSDAASMPDVGIICEQEFEGELQIGILLNWDKRYITLCPRATLIGLGFRLFDPNHILGEKDEIGITCALIPAATPGVTTGRRHFPLNTGFLNGPTQGKDVFIPFDWVIGGKEMLGCGWRMLMDCLSAGRAISLPSSAVGGAEVASLACGAYARVRRQFNMPIGKFEGIEEPLARIGGLTYIVKSGLSFTAAAIDYGAKPAVASAILKYHTTEMARMISNDSMDIHGGKGICLGPKNYLGRTYQGSPIAITVEGANILTRSLIIFGQGVMRCHKYVFEELEAARSQDLTRFDKAIFGHLGMFLSSIARSLVFGLTDGKLFKTRHKKMKRIFQLMNRYSANLAFLSDASMIILGSSLKRKEKMSARLGDVLSYLYLCSSCVKNYYDEGAEEEDLALLNWSVWYLFYEIEVAMKELINNFPFRPLRMLLRVIVFPLGAWRNRPSDNLGKKVAEILINDTRARQKLCEDAFQQSLDNNPVGQLEEAFKLIIAVNDLEKKVLQAYREKKISGLTLTEKINSALENNIINGDEAQQLTAADVARSEIIAVDDFDHNELARS